MKYSFRLFKFDCCIVIVNILTLIFKIGKYCCEVSLELREIILDYSEQFLLEKYQ